MKLGIMQPYFMPYIGYFQLIAAVDVFIVYDNIKYTKKGWINRNRMLVNGTDAMFSLSLKKDSDTLDIVQRALSSDFDRIKILNQMRGAYVNAPQFENTYPLIERIVNNKNNNLFLYIYNSILQLCAHLEITTEIKISSGVPIESGLKGQDKVLAICKANAAETYINAIGGVELYDADAFRNQGVELQFIKPQPFEYVQLGHSFVPWLSMIDVLMFNPIVEVINRVNNGFDLIGAPK
jgi:hypothetical protein